MLVAALSMGAPWHPYADDTAIARLALSERGGHPDVQRWGSIFGTYCSDPQRTSESLLGVLALAAHRRPIASLESSLAALPDLSSIEDPSTLAVVHVALDYRRALSAFGVTL